MSVYDRLSKLGITLPEPIAPVAAFVPAVRTGKLVFVSGHVARRDGQPWTGKLGAGLTVAEGREAARLVAIELLGTLQGAVGSLDAVRRIVKLLVLVNCAPDFTAPHLVANGASELLNEVFGPIGAHARSAFGVARCRWARASRSS